MNHIATSQPPCREPPETVLMGQNHRTLVLHPPNAVVTSLCTEPRPPLKPRPDPPYPHHRREPGHRRSGRQRPPPSGLTHPCAVQRRRRPGRTRGPPPAAGRQPPPDRRAPPLKGQQHQ